MVCYNPFVSCLSAALTRASAILDIQGYQTTNRSGERVTASLTLPELQRLMTIFASNEVRAVGDNVAPAAEAEDDDNDPDYVDEDEDEEEDIGYYSYGWGSAAHARPWDRSGWWPKVTEPQKEGLDLLYSGEFGRLLHQIQTRGGQRSVARNLLSRGMSARPIPKEDITCVRFSTL